MDSKGPGRFIWVLQVLEGPYKFYRSWKVGMGSKGPGRLIWDLKVLEGSYGF